MDWTSASPSRPASMAALETVFSTTWKRLPNLLSLVTGLRERTGGEHPKGVPVSSSCCDMICMISTPTSFSDPLFVPSAILRKELLRTNADGFEVLFGYGAATAELSDSCPILDRAVPCACSDIPQQSTRASCDVPP